MRARQQFIMLGAALLLLATFVPFDVKGTPASGWDEAELLETDNSGSAYQPKIAVDSSGNAIAVWYQSDGTIDNIWANRYVVGRGWGTATMIETYDNGPAGNPDVAFDPSGNAIAVWQQNNGMVYNILFNRYQVGSGWGTASLVEFDNSGNAYDPRISFDKFGNAFAVWRQYDGMMYNIYGNIYTPGTGWGTPQLLETDNSGNANTPDISIDGAGNVIVVWHQFAGGRTNIWTNRYSVGTGWGTAELLENMLINAEFPKVAASRSGDAFAVWKLTDGLIYSIYANVYNRTTGWSPPQLLESVNTGFLDKPRTATDPSGNAIAVWEAFDGSHVSINGNYYGAGSGWGTTHTIVNYGSKHTYKPMITTDDLGNSYLVFTISESSYDDVMFSRYIPSAGWDVPQHVESASSGSALEPQVSASPRGEVLIVWHQHDKYRYNIWANRYVIPDTTPPALVITSPNDGMETDTNTVLVKGVTEPGGSVSINGIAAFVENNGTFSVLIPLKRGENTITVKASDPSGNIYSTSFKVRFSDPLMAQLSAVMSSLSLMDDRLNIITTEVSSLESILLLLEGRISSVEGSLGSLGSSYYENLSHIMGEIEWLKWDMEQARENLTLLNETLAGIGNGEEVNLSDIRSSIEALEEDLSEYRSKVGAIESDVERLEGDLSVIETDINKLKETDDDDDDEELDSLKRLVNVLAAGLCFLSLVVAVLFLALIVMVGRKRRDGLEE